MQLELPKIGEGRLRESIRWMLEHECDGVTVETMERDYKFRAEWCLRTFGDCKLDELIGRTGYERLRKIIKDNNADAEGGTKNITLKKKLEFLLRVLKYAANRELIDRARIPELPQMANDSVPKDSFHTHEQYRRFRAALPTGRHRVYTDVGFWTGMRREDIETTIKEWINPWRPFLDEKGNVVARGSFFLQNTKRKNFQPYWLPMDEEFRTCMKEFYEAYPMASSDLVTGKFSKPARWMDPASIRSGTPRITPHSWRRSRQTYLESKGIALSDIAYAVGAASVQIMKTHYLRPTAATLKRLATTSKEDEDFPDPLSTT